MSAFDARLTVVTLGVRDMRASIGFYEALGFARKVRATGEEVAFFDTGSIVLALYSWDELAADAGIGMKPGPEAFRGITLGWNCASPQVVDAALAHAVRAGATIIKPAKETSWGGYSGYFADPDGHPWEVVHAPMFPLSEDGRLMMPD